MPETKTNESIEVARSVFDIEIETLNLVKDSLDDNFLKAVDLIYSASGRVVVTGMGKSGWGSRVLQDEINPGIIQHPLGVIVFYNGRLLTEQVGVKLDGSFKITDVKTHMQSFHSVSSSMVRGVGVGGY